MNTNTVEHRTMVASTSLLTNGLADNIVNIGAAFWEKRMIAPGVNDIINSNIKEPKEKSRQLISALTSRVQISSKCFYEIMNVLIDQGAYLDVLMSELKEKYEKQGKVKCIGKFVDINYNYGSFRFIAAIYICTISKCNVLSKNMHVYIQWTLRITDT